jgi:chitin-binding protein
MKMKYNNKIFILVFTSAVFISFPSFTQAHGYINSPASRIYLCHLQYNTQCGLGQYEPHSVEGLKNFPHSGPADHHIASGGINRFSALNTQTPTRWQKSMIKTGPIVFSWHITAPHSTTSWRYFLTKPNWNNTAPLTRASFNLIPFCQYNSHGQIPNNQVTHLCVLPANRSGYNVILGVWDIADTANAFYQVIDVNLID